MEFAFDVFKFQYKNNDVYNRFIDFLGFNINNISNVYDFPFMPVSFFKTNIIKTKGWKEEQIFESSSTTGVYPSKHYIKDVEFYLKNTEICFNSIFTDVSDYCYFALLPSYLDRPNSSLIFMVEHFIKKSGCGNFYNFDIVNLKRDIESYSGSKKIMIFGVTFALLSFFENYNIQTKVEITETGGMKGRGPEIPRVQLHDMLLKKTHARQIYSEYGMTELLSQAYSLGDGVFKTPPSMKILISDITDPYLFLENGTTGKVNIIDLANIDSCSFISTEDLGRKFNDIDFEVLGRTDESEMRGCNLMYYN
ncbi:MAG: acyl transferase [Saprospiraceae bacterium]